MLCAGKKAGLVGLVSQVLLFRPAAIQAKAVTTAASVPVMERKYPLCVLEKFQTTGLCVCVCSSCTPWWCVEGMDIKLHIV